MWKTDKMEFAELAEFINKDIFPKPSCINVIKYIKNGGKWKIWYKETREIILKT